MPARRSAEFVPCSGARERVEAGADSLDREACSGVSTAIASIGRARPSTATRAAAASRPGCRGCGRCCSPAGREQRQLGLEARVRCRVKGPIAPEEHDPPLSRGERVVELFEGRRDAGLDARSDERSSRAESLTREGRRLRPLAFPFATSSRWGESDRSRRGASAGDAGANALGASA